MIPRSQAKATMFGRDADVAHEYIDRLVREHSEALRDRDTAKAETEKVRETNRSLREQIAALKAEVSELRAQAEPPPIEEVLADLADGKSCGSPGITRRPP